MSLESANKKSSQLPFEKLWNLLVKIPEGQVMSYLSVAKKLKLKNPRNVGWMLKQNKAAPQIPCHRVVRSDGSIGGYNGKVAGKEIERKIKLLKDEGVCFLANGKINPIAIR